LKKELRIYQEDCHEAVINEYNNGITRALITLFTGAGKTFLLIKLLERMGFKRVLWLSFQSELITQSGMAFIKDKWPEIYEYVDSVGFLEYVKQPNARIGVIKEDIFKTNTEVTMGSVMTVIRRLDKIDPNYFDCVVCDEAHLFMSKSANQIVTTLTPKLLIGCTATATRADGLPLSDIFQKIVYDYDLGRGIKDGWACEMDAVRIKTTTSLDNVKTTAGELNLKDLTNEVNTLSRNQQIVDSYKKYCDGRPCIAFCVDIQHSMDLAEQFRMNGYDCQAVSSNEELTPGRSENIRRYKDDKLKIITNVSILVAGFDKVDTGCIIMACPTKSLTKYLQSVGRGSRLKNKWYTDKWGQSCTILDIVDVTSRHNLVNAWELDKEKEPEDRVFISQEKRDKLLAERARKAFITHTREKDEIVSLLKIPKPKISNSFRMQEPASSKQLAWISSLGYDVINEHYTKEMCSQIIMDLPATEKQRNLLRFKGYDVDSVAVLTRGMMEAAMKDLEKREAAKLAKK